MIQLEKITIRKYMSLLRAGDDSEQTKEITKELNKSLENFGNGIDLALFMLQKDLLVLQCKLAIEILNRNDDKATVLNSRIEKIVKQIKDKTKEHKKTNPYKNFLAWLQSVERFLGFSIDKNNDLVYFSEATKSMLVSYENQKQQIEASKK